MIRAAAKNHDSVGVVVRPHDYFSVTEELRRNDGLTDDTRFTLAGAAFEYSHGYERAIDAYFKKQLADMGIVTEGDAV